MRRIITLFLSVMSFTLFAQQEVQFTQFEWNKLFYNPGVAGTSGSICVNLAHRSQWVGFDNAPTTQNLNAEIPLDILHGALSLSITNDQIGFFQDINAGIGYTYTTQVGNGTLGLGIMLNLKNKALNNAEWITPGVPESMDLSIIQNGASGIATDLNFGAYYNTPTYYVGISSGNLIAANTELDGTAGGVTQFTYDRHYYLMGGYNWQIPNTNWALQPNMLVKYSSVAQFDLNVNALYNNRLWGGLTYRLEDAIAAQVGYYVMPNFRFSYSYDITTSALSQASSGSHEILLSYCFKIEIPPRTPERYRNPVFL
ncbi:MAG: type IX secretion system membrane protein PorP/SprF [Schleiferiaceae bacterium]